MFYEFFVLPRFLQGSFILKCNEWWTSCLTWFQIASENWRSGLAKPEVMIPNRWPTTVSGLNQSFLKNPKHRGSMPWTRIPYWSQKYMQNEDVCAFLSNLTSSVASPICQEGQSERTFLIFAFLPNFFLFFPNFLSFFPIFPDFPLFFPDFWLIFCCQGWHSAPLDPPPMATPLDLTPLMSTAQTCTLEMSPLTFLSPLNPIHGDHTSHPITKIPFLWYCFA